MNDIPTHTLLADLRELEDIQRENYVGSPKWSQAEKFLRAIRRELETRTKERAA